MHIKQQQKPCNRSYGGGNMIIFTTLQSIPNEYLEFKGIRQIVKYNLSSYYNDAASLDALIPPTPIVTQSVVSGDCIDPGFDIEYHKYIFENPNAFNQFMGIIIPAYMNPDTLVQIMIQSSNLRDVITESLLKLIQQRYGYNVYIVNELDDFIYTDESDFSIPGLFSLDEDLARWTCMNPSLKEEFPYE